MIHQLFKEALINIRCLWLKAIFNITNSRALKAGDDYKVVHPVLKSSNAEIGNRYEPRRAGFKTPIFCLVYGAYFRNDFHQ